MKVTVWNIGKFWKRLMFPPDTEQYRYNRLRLLTDMPWEPWLHAGVWISTITALIIGERGVMPPINGIDWYWIAFGLVSPTLGFSSVWVLEHNTGRARYYGLWGRMISDFGLAIAIILYQLDRFLTHGNASVGLGIMPTLILSFCAWFTLTLVIRDVRFIIATEVLAAEIYRGVQALRFEEWMSERGGEHDNR